MIQPADNQNGWQGYVSFSWQTNFLLILNNENFLKGGNLLTKPAYFFKTGTEELFVEEIEVIKRVKEGDADAFSILVEKYHKHLLNFIFRLIGDADLVEDIGQEVFLSVYKSLKDFDEKRGTPFSAWLFITARNHCISELRKRRGKKIVPIDDIIVIEAKNKTSEETLIENERWEAVKASLRQLPEPYRSAILQSLNGDSLDEIALREGISTGTVKSRLFRAREKMKLLVKEYFGGKGYERV